MLSASSKADASRGVRTSPTRIRSGRIRSAFATRSATPTALPSRPGTHSRCTACECGRTSSLVSSMTTRRSSSGTAAASDRSSVLLPDPVAPLTTIVARARTHARSSSAASGCSPLAVHEGAGPESGMLNRRNLRIERLGPPIGAMTALARLPSRIRASTNGRSSVSSRPTLAAMRWARSATSSIVRKATSARASRPARSTYTSAGPLTSTSVTSGSSSSGCKGPKPKSSAQSASSCVSVTPSRATERTRSRRSVRRRGSA